MRALVISGGVAQYLMEREQKHYDMFLGTSTEVYWYHIWHAEKLISFMIFLRMFSSTIFLV